MKMFIIFSLQQFLLVSWTFLCFFCISIFLTVVFCKKEWIFVPLLEVFINLNYDPGYYWDTNLLFSIFFVYTFEMILSLLCGNRTRHFLIISEELKISVSFQKKQQTGKLLWRTTFKFSHHFWTKWMCLSQDFAVKYSYQLSEVQLFF